LGEKAASNEVINGLLRLLGYTNDRVRNSACEALWKCGKIAEINKVSAILLDAEWDNEFRMMDIVGESSGKVFDLLPCTWNLEEDIAKNENGSHSGNCWFRENSFPDEFIRVFLRTKRSFWLPVITSLSIGKGYGITVMENTVVVYGSKEPVELPFSDEELGQRLQNHLLNWLDESLKI
jgi:hypothetical protein